MLDIMSQAKNAIESYNLALKVSSASIANMNVPGYKKIDVSFQSIFEKVLTRGTAAGTNQGGTDPEQFGQGMGVATTGIDFSAGDTTQGTTFDLAINGNGLFVVSPDGGNSFLYTRAGNFQLDNNGNMLSNNLQVYGLDNSGNLVPIILSPSVYQGATKANFQWLADGRLQYSATPTDTSTFTDTGYKIALTSFANPSGLVQAQGTTFAATLASGNAATAQAPGGAVGTLTIGSVEQSNVNYLAETINALEIQRAMSANLSVVKMASDTITSFISKLG
ncbi:MAG TPA: flagellar hook basal-body protein [Candidatus Sulfotelmatobacter sp.]|nr:flagellar hook basal-body protein [Candidatus Sulfotelmatobacter sp.]